MFFVTFNMVDMSIKCIKNIKIVFELLLFIRINIIIPDFRSFTKNIVL